MKLLLNKMIYDRFLVLILEAKIGKQLLKYIRGVSSETISDCFG